MNRATERLLQISSTEGTTSRLPSGRLAHVVEIGSTMEFLASSRSSYTSGAVLTIDGGLSATTQGL